MTLKSISCTTLVACMFLVSCGGDKNADKTEQKKTETTQEEIVEELFVARTVGELMVELESNMSWESVTEAWKTRREGWVAECYAATDVKSKANLLLEIEGYVQWSAVDQSWANIRESWSQDCLNSESDSELGDLLAVFEAYVLWEVVSPNWVNLREDCIIRCEEIE